MTGEQCGGTSSKGVLIIYIVIAKLGMAGQMDHESNPDAPCMDYLSTLGEKRPHSNGNVGCLNILHGASGNE